MEYAILVHYLRQRRGEYLPWIYLTEAGIERSWNPYLHAELPTKLSVGVDAAMAEGFLRRKKGRCAVHPTRNYP
jgi:hypothetical protein